MAIFISLLSTEARTAEILSSWSWMLCSYSERAAFSGSMDVLVVLADVRGVIEGGGGKVVSLSGTYVCY